jgi:hypothetical protein
MSPRKLGEGAALNHFASLHHAEGVLLAVCSVPDRRTAIPFLLMGGTDWLARSITVVTCFSPCRGHWCFAFVDIPYGTVANHDREEHRVEPGKRTVEPGDQGDTLFVDGWYGLARKVHYSCDMFFALSWALITGMSQL